MTKKKSKLLIKEHILMPKHVKLSEKEKKELLEKHNISMVELPKIYADDSAIQELNVTEGDVIKITRHSGTRRENIFFRGVINE